MVRNIDLVEALIFYGRESIFMIGDDNDMEEDKKENNKPHDSFQMLLLPGVENLIEECKRDETAVLVILEDIQEGSLSPSAILGNYVTIRTERGRPPNPKDLWDAIHSIEINPRGFGGSSGFGRKAADPRRSPLPKHCVVLCHTVDQCRAARYAGMRVLCLADNALADAIIDDGGSWESIGMDDIATPGSFWLNPPHPKDDEGNAVDPVSIIQAYYDQQEKDDPSMINQAAKQLKRDRPSSSSSAGDDIEEDEYLAAILADIDPL
jgi:beta-phosphoglucomutase-like phosphatase (HAD superfamily)